MTGRSFQAKQRLATVIAVYTMEQLLSKLQRKERKRGEERERESERVARQSPADRRTNREFIVLVHVFDGAGSVLQFNGLRFGRGWLAGCTLKHTPLAPVLSEQLLSSQSRKKPTNPCDFTTICLQIHIPGPRPNNTFIIGELMEYLALQIHPVNKFVKQSTRTQPAESLHISMFTSLT